MSNIKRPHIICHMMSTIEGKIASGEETDILDDYFGLYTETEDKLEARAWMCGRVTMQMFASKVESPLPSNDNNISEGDFITPHEGNFFMFGVDTKGLLRWETNTIRLSNVSENLNLVIVVTKTTPKPYLAYLQEKGISYLITGDDEIDFDSLFKTMKDKLGVEKLLLEGGGLLDGSVMAAGLIDEISLLVTPLVVNSSKAPSVFERHEVEPLDITQYSLTDVQRLEKDTVWLRYKKLDQ